MRRNRRVGRVLAALAALAIAHEVQAYAFGVSPIRVDFDGKARTASVTVANDDAVKLSFQMRLVRWTQNAAGEDRYEDSKDLVYFPRLMSVEPKDRRVIRLGTQAPPPAVEGTYRLVIEEMAQPSAAAKGSTAIAVRMRFAVPVFVAPAEPVVKATITDAEVRKGELHVRLRNEGNRHVKVDSIVLRRGTTTLAEGQGWYVLASAQRAFTVRVPADACERAGPVQLVVKGQSLDLKRELTIDPGRCRP